MSSLWWDKKGRAPTRGAPTNRKITHNFGQALRKMPLCQCRQAVRRNAQVRQYNTFTRAQTWRRRGNPCGCPGFPLTIASEMAGHNSARGLCKMCPQRWLDIPSKPATTQPHSPKSDRYIHRRHPCGCPGFCGGGSHFPGHYGSQGLVTLTSRPLKSATFQVATDRS